MKVSHTQFSIFFVLTLLLPALVSAKLGICAPVTWSNDEKYGTTTQLFPPMSTGELPCIPAPIKPGDINCRYHAQPYDSVDRHTCMDICNSYDTTMEKFLLLNPQLKRDCSNIKPGIEYCVIGFIEPIRAFDGRCGPKNKNATCSGTAAQCCNAETFTCGNSPEDCAPGTCYEGACYGDKVYSTDGTCGKQHRNRLCAGKWGDCCNVDGKCGTGEAFCSTKVCQSGNCVNHPAEPFE